jgi:nitrite reductase (NO-forming)
MSNAGAVVGALAAGIVGGSLFAAALVAQPRVTAEAPVLQMPPGMMTSPSGASMVMPPGYGPGVKMTSGDETKPEVVRATADGYAPLPLPQVAAPVGVRPPTTVKYEVETHEVTALMDDGVAYTYWTFGGTVPGPMLRVRQGDTVELTLKNAPESKLSHSIDLHAITGPGGGAKVTQIAPGESATFTFKALNPGAFIYHCASPLVPQHIANGMYGMIIVEPPEGLPPVDHEFYVMQGDFYLEGDRAEHGLHDFSLLDMVDEHPNYVVFNGSVGALTGDRALKASVGDTVRIFFGVGGPNTVSSFHVIGEILDRVYPEGATSPVLQNVQTTLVPAGGATIAEFKLNYPGNYTLVDHSLGRMTKGAVGLLQVDGAADPEVFNVIESPGHPDMGH